MPRPALSPAERSILRTRDVAFSTSSYTSVTGAAVLAKEDPVLAMLASSDEREYETMRRTSHAIGSALNQRRTGVLQAGSRLVPSERSTPGARILFDYCVAALRSINRFRTTRSEVLGVVHLGWRPNLVEWDDRVIGGATKWVPVAALPLQPWHFQVTVDDHLVRVEGKDGPRVFNDPIDQWRFFRASAGAVSTPYGESVLQGLWLVYFLQKKWERLGWGQVQRSLGILKAWKEGGSTQAADKLRIDAELRQVLKLLNSSNLLVEHGGWKLAVENVPDVVKNTVELHNYWNTQIRINLLGQNLTSEVKGGSYAAAREHGDVLHSVLAGDAAEEEGWWNDGLLRMAIELNFGEVDLEDLPKWRNLATLPQTDVERAKAFVEMGGPLDARRLADRWNLPMAPDDVDVPTLTRQTGVVAPAPPPARAARAAGSPPSVRAAEGAELDPAAALGAHYAAILDRFREANPDPKAPGRPSGRSPKPPPS